MEITLHNSGKVRFSLTDCKSSGGIYDQANELKIEWIFLDYTVNLMTFF